MATREVSGRGTPPAERRLPPGQSLTSAFPVLSAGPTPKVDTRTWTFTIKEGPRPFVLVHSIDGYSTNLPTADLAGDRAMVALYYDDQPIAPEHGGPARLVVPHLYFWKSAKWINGLQFLDRDEAGFWELRGYHMRGDPWQEQRYTDD